MGLPRTSLGLIGFILFTGWIISMMFSSQDQGLHALNENIENTQTNIANNMKDTAQNLTSPETGEGSWFGTSYAAITGSFQVFLNFLILIAEFFLVIFVAFATFLGTITMLPIQISEILILLLSIGLIFSLLSKVIET